MSTKQVFLSTALVAAALSLSAPASAGSDEYIGEVILTGYTFCPRGTAAADGQLVAINSNQALFSLYGTTYGGDGRTTFALPDLRGRAVVHEGTGPGLSPRRLGQRGGSEETNAIPLKTGNSDEERRVIDGRSSNNMQPFLTMRYCIVTQGMFPSRN